MVSLSISAKACLLAYVGTFYANLFVYVCICYGCADTLILLKLTAPGS